MLCDRFSVVRHSARASRWKAVAMAVAVSAAAGTVMPFLFAGMERLRLPALMVYFLGLAAFPALLRLARGRASDVFALDTVFLVFFALYSLSIPMNALLSPGVSQLYVERVEQVMFLCLLALAGYLIGFHNRLGMVLGGSRRQRCASWEPRRSRLTAIWLLLLGGIAYFAVLLRVGIGAYFSAGYAGRSLLKLETGPVEIGLYFIAAGIVLYSVYRYSARGRLSVGGHRWWSATHCSASFSGSVARC